MAVIATGFTVCKKLKPVRAEELSLSLCLRVLPQKKATIEFAFLYLFSNRKSGTEMRIAMFVVCGSKQAELVASHVCPLPQPYHQAETKFHHCARITETETTNKIVF